MYKLYGPLLLVGVKLPLFEVYFSVDANYLWMRGERFFFLLLGVTLVSLLV